MLAKRTSIMRRWSSFAPSLSGLPLDDAADECMASLTCSAVWATGGPCRWSLRVYFPLAFVEKVPEESVALPATPSLGGLPPFRVMDRVAIVQPPVRMGPEQVSETLDEVGGAAFAPQAVEVAQ